VTREKKNESCLSVNYKSHVSLSITTVMFTGWRKLIGSPKLQIIFHKRATKYRLLLLKMTYKDKGSYESSPLCICHSQHDSVIHKMNESCLSINHYMNESCLSINHNMNESCLSINHNMNESCLSINHNMNESCLSINHNMNESCLSVNHNMSKFICSMTHTEENIWTHQCSQIIKRW